MNTIKTTKLTRIALFICGLALLTVLFVPLWQIDLVAPQYPEGLTLLIYANKLAGNVDIINGLNHYIGMKTLHKEDFVEFTVLPGIIIFFSIFFISVAFAGRKKWLNILCVFFVAFGILAMVDFWRWEYAYGHDLNPDAAIIVPGMAYQPPLIGFKQLLNFGAYSIPAMGGWIFVLVGAAVVSLAVYEWNKNKKSITHSNKLHLLIIGLLGCSLSACSTDPQPIRIGQDNCDFCKMTISDNRFGAEVVTQKGKVYKFDDTHCIISFIKAETLDKKDIAAVYFVDFNDPHQLLNADQAYFLQSPSLKSPMNGNIAAFSHEESLAEALPSFYGNAITWEEMQK
ncbi:MAG: nitrous oxide reductase accessory protein NosL [Daejeonella sp.]